MHNRKLVYKVTCAIKKVNDDDTTNKVRKLMKDLGGSKGEFDDGAVEYKAPRKMDVSRIIEAVAKMEQASPHETEETEKMRWKDMYSDVEFYDDVNGGNQLDKEGVVAARKLELGFFGKMEVYRKVPRSEARGRKLITASLVDTRRPGVTEGASIHEPAALHQHVSDALHRVSHANVQAAIALALAKLGKGTGEGSGLC